MTVSQRKVLLWDIYRSNFGCRMRPTLETTYCPIFRIVMDTKSKTWIGTFVYRR